MKKQQEAVKTAKVVVSSTSPLLIISLKFMLLTAIIAGGIIYCESKGYFESDDRNNHTLKKWTSFYEFTERNNVDILLVGNSHLYTGINPKNLSTSLGVNAFILASPGTRIADSYYSLKEAIKKCTPAVVVVETYGIKAFNQYEFKDGILSDQFKSFSARKHFLTKLTSTPFLFATKNYPYAWSNTLRNHDFLYKNRKQLQKNIDKKKKPEKKKKLYLGRYARFQKGLQDTTLKKYETLGAPIDGKEYETNEYTEHYVNGIIEICEENNVELIFLTLPVYEKHIVDYPVWKNKLALVLGKYAENNWIDFQDSSGYKGFTTRTFENTYKINQHMTGPGSLMATYKLADYLMERETLKLPNRKTDQDWRNLFYGEEGFFENNSPKPDDKKNIILYTNENITPGQVSVSEILLLKKDTMNIIRAKINYEGPDINKLRNKKIRLLITVKDQKGVVQRSYIDLQYDRFHSLKNRLNFARGIKQVEVLAVNKIAII